jgi:hypothetical protein
MVDAEAGVRARGPAATILHPPNIERISPIPPLTQARSTGQRRKRPERCAEDQVLRGKAIERRCGSRLASRCPSCSALYATDGRPSTGRLTDPVTGQPLALVRPSTEWH